MYNRGTSSICIFLLGFTGTDSEFSDSLEKEYIGAYDGENIACVFLQPIASATTAEQKKKKVKYKLSNLQLKS